MEKKKLQKITFLKQMILKQIMFLKQMILKHHAQKDAVKIKSIQIKIVLKK